MAAAYTAACELWLARERRSFASTLQMEGSSINRGQPWVARQGIAEMAAGFFADVPNAHFGLR